MEKKIENAINRQINAELWSAYLYLAMSLYAEKNGLKGVGHWMYIQWKEELDHARILEEFMIKTGSNIELQTIDDVPSSWDSIHEIFKDAFIHEQQVTYMINRLMKTALEEEDFAVVSLMHLFVDEQVEEEHSVRNILNALNMLDNDTAAIYEFDKELLERKYTPSKLLR